MKPMKITQERINALRVIKNISVEQLAADIGVPVHVMKVWCGQRLTFLEWFKFRVLGGGFVNGTMESCSGTP